MGHANGSVPASDGWFGRLLHRSRLAWTMDAAPAPALVPRRQAPLSRLSTHPPSLPSTRPLAPNPTVGTDRHFGEARILVVDDNPVNLLVASEMLSQWGIRPLIAADGAEAVALALELPLDLVLMDLQMPVLDGYKATDQIRQFERDNGRARVPIVAYTLSPWVDEQHLRERGFDGVLHKPCDAATLLECLQRDMTPMPRTLGGATPNCTRAQT